MKIILSALLVICLANQSCTVIDHAKSNGDVNSIRALVREGDNIRDAREILIKNGFSPSEINKPTVAQDSYRFTVRLTEPTQLDYFGNSVDLNLNPWRNGVKHWIAIAARLDEVIYRIYTD
jgi:hypothetical protein